MTIMMASAIMIIWPISVAVSTPPSHGGDSGSSPGSATKHTLILNPIQIMVRLLHDLSGRLV